MLQLRAKPIRIAYKHKWLFFALVVSLVPVLLQGVISSVIAGNSLQEEVLQHQQTALKQISMRVDSNVGRLDQISLMLGAHPAIVKAYEQGISMENLEGTKALFETLQHAIATSDMPINVSLVLTSFNTVYSHHSGLNRQIEFPYDEIVKRTKEFTSSGSFKIPPNTFGNQKDLLVVRPIPMNASVFHGLLITHLNTDRLQETIEQMDLPGNREIILVDDRNQFIAGGSTKSGGKPLASPEKKIASILDHQSVSGDLPELVSIEGEDYMVSYIKSAVSGWTYIATSPAKELTHKSDEIVRLSWLIMLTMCIIWAVIAIIGSNRLFSPIQRLFLTIAGKDGREHYGDPIRALDSYMHHMQDTNDTLLNRLNEQMPAMKRQFLQQLVEGELSVRAIEQQEESLLGELRDNWFYVGLVEVDQMLLFKQQYNEGDRLQIMNTLSKVLEEISESICPLTVFSPKHGRLVFLAGTEEATPDRLHRLRDIGHELQSRVSQDYSFTVSVVISTARERATSIHRSYEEVLSYLDYRLVSGTSLVITPENLSETSRLTTRHIVKAEADIVSSVEQGDFETAKQKLGEIVHHVAASLTSSEVILGLFAHLLGELDHVVQEYGEDLDSLLETDTLKMLYSIPSLQGIHQWMSNQVMDSIRAHMEAHLRPKHKKVVAQTMLTIRESDESGLSLLSIAEQHGVSQRTLSKWFKQETGENLGDFWIRSRMEKAKEWLLHSDMPVKEIAERLGYTTLQNFSRIFKQTTGVAPSYFRAQIQDKDSES
ncbi:MAG: helix-turn-helix protein [Paenibacillus sp.]|nr:helix-turn-helix protein [Paenibacillus sp.]